MQDIQMLDNHQRAAVTDTDGYTVIIAGAGSGKTRVLASRVTHLLARGMQPQDILCITFTNRAADEMRSRIETYSGRDVSGMQISTYHSICAGILRRYGDAVGISQDFSIYETKETTAILNKIISGSAIRGTTTKQLQGEIDRYKAGFYSQEDLRRKLEYMRDDCYADDILRGYALYEEVMRSENALDFGDLIRYTLRLVQLRPDVLREVSFRYILVDEYQDSSPVEAELIRLLSMRYGNLCVVGDPRQNIYSWRGSDYRLIMGFENTYPGAKRHVLNVNYRSARKIVQASEIIAGSCTGIPNFGCRPFRCDEGQVVMLECTNTRDEAESIAAAVAQTISTGEVNSSDIAVLCRTHAQCRSARSELSRKKISCTTADKNGFYDRPEIRLALDCLRSVADPHHTPLPSPISPDVLHNLRALYHCGVTVTGLLDAVSPHIIRSLATGPTAAELAGMNLKALSGDTLNHPGPAFHALAEFMKSCDTRHEPVEGVSVMTIHAAKGLEFPVVFVSGMAGSPMYGSAGQGEETRLMYVAVTRAISTLGITL